VALGCGRSLGYENRAVRPVLWITLLRLLALVALAASTALLVDYTGGAPAFCSAGSGCAAVRASGFGRLLGIPVPVFGLLGFAALFAATLVTRSDLRRKLVLALGVLGAVIALALLLIQWISIKQFCAFCVVVDVAGMLGGVCAVLYAQSARAGTEITKSKSKPPAPSDPLRTWAWVMLAAIAIAAPLLWSDLRPQPPVPSGVGALYHAGKINVVEFADYECPFCRLLHDRLKAIIKDYPGKVNFVRLNMPLQSHPNARNAARAGLCAEAQGKGETVADHLFAAEDLSPAANRRAAGDLGLDLAVFDRCVADAETDRKIDAQAKILRDAGFQGLPTTFVGARMIVGAQPEEVFREAFARAERREGENGIPGPVFLGLLVVVAGAVIGVGRHGARKS
jgi:predicted DsbA family dithiol-disulfide isomerase/uncharacterized membrane protein